jgi:SAM-dependent methyltransferase
MLRDAIRNLPGVPLLIKLNTDIEDWWFDLRYGTETTADRVDQTRKGWETDPDNHTYLATRPKCVRRAFSALPVKDFRDYTFIDFGSGKGRALLMAADLQFKSLIGIELRKELHDKAVNNFRNRRKVRSSKIESINMNALDYEYPSGNLVLYFSNPFGEEVLRSVLLNLGRSLESDPRDVIIVFAMYVPDFMQLADTLPFLSLTAAGHGYRVYRSRATRQLAAAS